MNPTAIVVLGLIVVALIVHVLGFWPSPGETAERLVSDMASNKGVELSSERRVELRDDLVATLTLHRALDIGLALALGLLGVAVLRGRQKLALGVAILYAILNSTYLGSAWGVSDHGLGNVMNSMLTQMKMDFRAGAFEGVFFKLSRPFTLLLGMTLAFALAFRRIRSRLWR